MVFAARRDAAGDDNAAAQATFAHHDRDRGPLRYLRIGAIRSVVERHLERSFGSPVARRSIAPRTAEWASIELLEFDGVPVAGARTWVTLGLAEDAVEIGGRQLRQELMIALRTPIPKSLRVEIGTVLGGAGRLSLATGHGYVPGQLLPFRGPVFDRLPFETLYSSDVSYIDPDVRVVQGVDPPCLLAWLIPVYAEEVAAIRARGWQAFEQRLVDLDVDVCWVCPAGP